MQTTSGCRNLVTVISSLCLRSAAWWLAFSTEGLASETGWIQCGLFFYWHAFSFSTHVIVITLLMFRILLPSTAFRIPR